MTPGVVNEKKVTMFPEWPEFVKEKKTKKNALPRVLL